MVQDNPEFLEISPDGSLLAVGSENGEINIWRASDRTILATMQQDLLLSMAISHDGKNCVKR
jgi:WD40 repeat protein